MDNIRIAIDYKINHQKKIINNQYSIVVFIEKPKELVFKFEYNNTIHSIFIDWGDGCFYSTTTKSPQIQLKHKYYLSGYYLIKIFDDKKNIYAMNCENQNIIRFIPPLYSYNHKHFNLLNNKLEANSLLEFLEIINSYNTYNGYIALNNNIITSNALLLIEKLKTRNWEFILK